MDFIRFAFRRHPILTAGFLAALAAFLFFGGRLIADALYFADPAHRQQALEPWMTPHYVAMSWGLPREIVIEIMDITPQPGRPERLDKIAARLGITLDELEDRVRNARDRLEADRP